MLKRRLHRRLYHHVLHRQRPSERTPTRNRPSADKASRSPSRCHAPPVTSAIFPCSLIRSSTRSCAVSYRRSVAHPRKKVVPADLAARDPQSVSGTADGVGTAEQWRARRNGCDRRQVVDPELAAGWPELSSPDISIRVRAPARMSASSTRPSLMPLSLLIEAAPPYAHSGKGCD
jgi:hypothetical protein